MNINEQPKAVDIRILFLEAQARSDKEKTNITDYFYQVLKQLSDLQEENKQLKQRIVELSQPKA